MKRVWYVMYYIIWQDVCVWVWRACVFVCAFCAQRDRAIFNAMRWDDTVHFHSYMSVCNKRSLRTIIHYHHTLSTIHSVRYVHSYIRYTLLLLLLLQTTRGINKPKWWPKNTFPCASVYLFLPACKRMVWMGARDLCTDQICHYWDLCAN